MKKRYFIILVIGLIIGVFSLLFFQLASTEGQEASESKQAAIMATRGELMPFKMDMSQYFEIDLGNNQFSESPQELAQGIDVLTMLNLGFSWPFQVGFKDNKMSICANITNSDNETVGRIVDNGWHSAGPDSMSIGDRNYNDYAFEILDVNNMPIFNVRAVGSNKIQIGGLFNVAGGRVLISDNGGGIVGNPNQQDIADSITPIFKYPSSEHIGELVNPTYLSSMPTDNSDRMSWEASVLTVIAWIFVVLGTLLAIIAEIVREKDGVKRRESHVQKANRNKKKQKQKTWSFLKM